MKPQLLTIFLLFTIASCTPSTSLTENEKASITNDVQQTLNNYCDDIRKAGLTAEFNYLDTSSEFFWVPPGFSGSLSYDSVATILKQNAPAYKSIDNAFDTLRITPLTHELATYTGRLSSTMTDTTHKVMTFSLVETGVLIKRQDGWKLLQGQTSILERDD